MRDDKFPRAPLHVVHANSSGGAGIERFLATIAAARDSGQDVTTEAYPYNASQTTIQSALFDGWEGWSDERFAQYEWAQTGERLNTYDLSDRGVGYMTVGEDGLFVTTNDTFNNDIREIDIDSGRIVQTIPSDRAIGAIAVQK